MLRAAGFPEVDVFRRIDAEVCIGRDIEEAERIASAISARN